MKNKILAICLIGLSLIGTACAHPEAYTDQIASETLADVLAQSIDVHGTLQTDTGSGIEAYFPLPDYVIDQSIRYAPAADNADEFGVLHVKEGYAADCKRLLEERYLLALQEEKTEFYRSYAEEQAQKLERATVRVFGNYVVYAILDTDVRNDLFTAAQKALHSND